MLHALQREVALSIQTIKPMLAQECTLTEQLCVRKSPEHEKRAIHQEKEELAAALQRLRAHLSACNKAIPCATLAQHHRCELVRLRALQRERQASLDDLHLHPERWLDFERGSVAAQARDLQLRMFCTSSDIGVQVLLCYKVYCNCCLVYLCRPRLISLISNSIM